MIYHGYFNDVILIADSVMPSRSTVMVATLVALIALLSIFVNIWLNHRIGIK